MRFILKSAFWLGFVAFLLPFGTGARDTTVSISMFDALLGAQQALQDVVGFCERAPRACDTGRDVAVFAGERIGDGIAIAYGFVETSRSAPAADRPVAVAADADAVAARPTDPIMTGAVAATEVRMPQPYLPPKRAAEPDTTVRSPQATPSSTVRLPAIPTPAPRLSAR